MSVINQDNELTFQHTIKDYVLPDLTNDPFHTTVTVLFSHTGDDSVGVDGDSAKVTLDVSMYDSEDSKLYLDYMTEKLSETFREIWDFPVNSEIL